MTLESETAGVDTSYLAPAGGYGRKMEKAGTVEAFTYNTVNYAAGSTEPVSYTHLAY